MDTTKYVVRYGASQGLSSAKVCNLTLPHGEVAISHDDHIIRGTVLG